ncbi:hypothetical protein E8E11_011636, partial [Didymella keratinophila]
PKPATPLTTTSSTTTCASPVLTFRSLTINMAILPAFPGLTVEILMNGVPLQEYDDEDEEAGPPNTITK